jgi:hypothetical protein
LVKRRGKMADTKREPPRDTEVEKHVTEEFQRQKEEGRGEIREAPRAVTATPKKEAQK